MRSSPQSWSFLVVALGAAGCIPPLDTGSGGAPMERAETTESRASTSTTDTADPDLLTAQPRLSAEPGRFVPGARVSPSCSLCLQACRVSLRNCRYVADGRPGGDGGYLRCEIDRGGCASRCRHVCR